MFVLAITSVIVLLTFLLFVVYDHRTIYLIWKYPKVKAFAFIPFLGHLGLTRYINPSIEYFMEFIDILANESGNLTYFLGHKLIVVYKAHHINEIFTNRYTQGKSDYYDFMTSFVGDSIFRIGGKPWKRNRKAMIPTMKVESLAPLTEGINMQVDSLLKQLEKKVGKTFDAMPDIAKYVINVVMKSAFGIGIDSQVNKMVHCIDLFGECLMCRMISMVKYPNLIYRFTKDYKIQQECVHYGNMLVDNIISQRKATYQKNLPDKRNEIITEDIASSGHIFLDYLFKLQSEAFFTEQNVKDEARSILVGGFDTTTSTISFTALLLGMHQDIQEKVYQEVMNVLGADRPIEYKDLAKLKYLEKVIKESMRLFPPVPIIGRVAEQEFLLDGHIVPKGTQIGIHILKTYRSPLYWKNPLKFIPERFNPEELSKQEKNSYMPFSAGPRNCFGMNLAWLFLKITLASLIRKYKLFTPHKDVEDIKLTVKITLKSVDGILLNIKERT